LALFFVQVKAIAYAETDAIIELEKMEVRMDIEQELRTTRVDPDTLTMWKHLKQAPGWLFGDDYRALEEWKAVMVERERARQAELIASRNDVTFTSIRAPDYALIKSGKFGPEIEEFTMPLPVNFPIRAGQSKFAIQPALELHEAVLQKLRVSALPQTLEECKVSTA
jgi:hypothetical protein